MNEATRWRFALAEDIGAAYAANGATVDRLRHAAGTAEELPAYDRRR
jgi:hypothetical protein